MNIALWIGQALLALMFLNAGVMKTIQYEKSKAKMPWMKEYSKGLVHFIGIAELLAAVGFILPAALGVLPWLTGAAGVGIAIIMVLAIGVHGRKGEYGAVVMNIVLLAISVFIAIGRF
ncbi:DoxX family protein [Paenibacillus sp. R14(2021)]|uniref:DoxX family protein n=1 Tax=Paenibacillus sp. R14(2021) TaxID=2859228 RepID=UPI001C612BFD|nr:DoxX family protein [Paenibacillus sp. R14(2021)]